MRKFRVGDTVMVSEKFLQGHDRFLIRERWRGLLGIVVHDDRDEEKPNPSGFPFFEEKGWYKILFTTGPKKEVHEPVGTWSGAGDARIAWFKEGSLEFWRPSGRASLRGKGTRRQRKKERKERDRHGLRK